jgi:hypothetical protein
MKPQGKFRITNLKPVIEISNHDLEAIRHIVDIAPQEAQWYHTVTKDTTGSVVTYKIEGMYIPEQFTSAASVETDPNMMVTFFKELRDKVGPEETNQIISKMTCWCHSHVNMGVSPSGQDHKQFAQQCENAIRDNVTNPQIMLIFNKRDDYYCQIFDPEYNLIFENVDIVETSYDFSWIDEQAKLKFKKKKYTKSYSKKKYSSYPSSRNMYSSKSNFLDWEDISWSNQKDSPISEYEEWRILYPELRLPSLLSHHISKLESATKKDYSQILREISNLTEQEIAYISFLTDYAVNDSNDSILDVTTQEESTLEENLCKIEDLIDSVDLDLFHCILMISTNLSALDIIKPLEDLEELIIGSSSTTTIF